MSHKVFLVSLGCPKNLVDTEILAGTLLSNGDGLTFDPGEADVYLINTCAFLPSAREEAYHAIREAANWKKRAKKTIRQIIVAGCLTEFDKHAHIREQYPEVDLWTGVNDIPNLVKLLHDNGEPDLQDKPSYLYDEKTPRLQLTAPHLAYLKIADGCNNKCSYCAIPGIRGTLRSRSIASVVSEAKNLLDNGVKELIVIAQDITVFGLDRPQDHETCADLLYALDKLPGEFKIRLLYTHPAHYTDAFIAAVAACRHVLPYLDIPLQHASERILRSMNRHVDKATTEKWLGKLRKDIPDLVLRTTFITGLPGETEAEFAELCEFIQKWRFERCGVFAFAPEAGTPAASMPDQVPTAIAEARAAKLMELQKPIMLAYQQSQIGKTLPVIVDAVEPPYAYGRGAADAPDIDNYVIIKKGGRLQEGKTYDIIIESVEDMNLIGHRVSK